jgi:hypothetical protein
MIDGMAAETDVFEHSTPRCTTGTWGRRIRATWNAAPSATPTTATLERDLREAGFESVETETVGLSSRVSARDAARGIVLGSPFRAEIERLDASALERATAAVEQALRPWDGSDAPMSAHVATARR